MKKSLLLTMSTLLVIFFSSEIFAQSDSIVWNLTTSPGSGIVASGDATIIPSNVVKGANLDGASVFNANGFGTAGNTSAGWDETNINAAISNNAFVEFSFQLACGRNFDLDSLSFFARTSAGGITPPVSNSLIRVSIDGSAFDSISTFPSNVNSASEVALKFNLNPNITLIQGQTISFRIFAANINTNTDTLYIRNFVIKGTKSTGAITGNAGSNTTICSGNSTNISVSNISGGTANYDVDWNNGATDCANVASSCTSTVSPSANTTFTAIVTDANGCSASFTQTIAVNQPSVSPTGITGVSTLCNGQSTTLTLQGGSLGTNASFKWYSGSCGGTLEGTGNSISVNPSATTTYFVRAEGTSAPCTANSTCVQITVTVNQPSSAPTGISGNNVICTGQSTTLTRQGGTLGTNANFFWYSGTCGGTLEGSGPSVTVSPLVTTTYFVRIEGAASPCVTTPTACVQITVTVNQGSQPPGSIGGITTICNGQTTTLNQIGGVLGTGATFEWYSGSCGGTPEGSGSSITVSPIVTTIYFVRVEGTASPCQGNTTCTQVTVIVNQPSVVPASISGISTICAGQNTTLTVGGGTLGTGATFVWYSGSCGGTLEGNGSSINVTPLVTTTYFVRIEGTTSPCSTSPTACASLTVNVNQPSIVPTGINGNTTICNGQSTTLTLQGGSLGTNATFHWYSSSCGGIAEGIGSTITVSPTVTTTYFVRAEGNLAPCNVNTSCAQIIVTVVQPSSTPTGISVSDTIQCSGASNTLTVQGGSLGTNASFQWYQGACGGAGSTSIGSTNSIVVNPINNSTSPITQTFFVRAENTQNPCIANTGCVSRTIIINPIPERINLFPDTICSGQVLNDTIIATFTNGVTYSWSTSGPSIVTGNLSSPPTTNNINTDTLINLTTNQQPSVTYTDTLIFTNVIRCLSFVTNTVVVNPAAPKAQVTDLTSVSGSIPTSLCGGTEFNSFNVTNGFGGINYSWLTSPPNVIVHEPDSLNTVITFPDSSSSYIATIIATSINQISLGGCPNDSMVFTVEISPGDQIQEAPIILKQPGNLLVYLDNTAFGYQWGFDSKNTFAPSKIAGQVYQTLDHPAVLPFDTTLRNYWVLVYKNNCVTKVYYNGPYASSKGSAPEIIPDEVSALVYPNPTNGIFDLVVSGNIYQNVYFKIINHIGQVVHAQTLYKDQPAQNYKVDIPSLAKGLYLVEIRGDYNEQATYKIVIK